MKSFKQFNEEKTEDYTPPEYLVKPADGEKMFYWLQNQMKKRKKYFKPGIHSANPPEIEHT